MKFKAINDSNKVNNMKNLCQTTQPIWKEYRMENKIYIS